MNRRIDTVLAFVAASLFAAEASPQADDSNDSPAGAAAGARTIAADPGDVDILTNARDALVAAGDFTAALPPAEELVSRLEQSDADDPRMAEHVLMLGRIQAELEQFEAAEANYLRAIELLEAREGELALALVEPYRGLARSYIGADRHAEAITLLEQARHVTQRHLGLFNVEQLAIMDEMTAAYLSAGDTAEAQRLQEQRVATALRQFGADDPRIIPFRNQLASYYDGSRMRISAREQYEEVLRIVEEEFGQHDVSVLGPLRELLRIDLLTGESGNRARLRLQEVLDVNPGVPEAERAQTLAALGDWEMVNSGPEPGLEYYRRAYRALEADPDIAPEALFSAPRMIDFVPPLSPVDQRARRRPFGWGTIVLAFSLSSNGRAGDVRIVSAEPEGLMEEAYTRRIMQTHFRPRLVDGQPVPTADLRFTHYFRYYVEEDAGEN